MGAPLQCCQVVAHSELERDLRKFIPGPAVIPFERWRFDADVLESWVSAQLKYAVTNSAELEFRNELQYHLIVHSDDTKGPVEGFVRKLQGVPMKDTSRL